MQVRHEYQAVEQSAVGFAVDEQAGRKIEPEVEPDGPGESGRSRTGCQNDLIGRNATGGRLDAAGLIVSPQYGADGRAGEDPRSLPLRVRQERQGSRSRLYRTFLRDVQRGFGLMGEIGFDGARLGASHAADAITPAAVLRLERCHVVGWQVPAKSAGPGQWDRGDRFDQPAPFRHGADAQVEIGARIARTGVDPGERGGRGAAARFVGVDHGHVSTACGQVPSDRCADNPGTDNDDLRPGWHDRPVSSRW